MKPTIRTMTNLDVPQVVEVHLRTFRGFFLSFLGPKFLCALYEEILSLGDSECLVVTNGDDRTILGFVIGVADQTSMYSRLARRRWPRFALAALPVVAGHPSVLPRLFRAFHYPKASEKGAAPALLMSIGVLPEASGSHIGSGLVTHFLEAMRVRGVAEVSLTTDRDDNDRTNRFYQRLGFRVVRTYVTPEGRWMNEYLIQFERANQKWGPSPSLLTQEVNTV